MSDSSLRAALRANRLSSLNASRLFALLALLAVAALIAVGCGGDDGGGEGVSDSGGLAFVPADSVGVFIVSLREEDLDASLETLDRLPVWSLVETQLPESNAAGLLELAGDQTIKDDAATDGMTYKKDIKPWLGDTAGVAVLEEVVEDPESFDGDDAPFVAWVDSEDDDKAREFVKRYVGKKEYSTSEHDGTELIEVESGTGSTVFVKDGALVVAPTEKIAKDVLDDDGDSFKDAKYVGGMLDSDDQDEQFVAVASTEKLLDMGSKIAKEQDDEDLQKLGDVLEDEDVRELLPDALGFSGGIDDIGLWFEGMWAPAAEQTVDDARELAEKMPDSIGVSAQGGQSEFLNNLPGAWEAVSEAYDIELDGLSSKCNAEDRALCELGVKLATSVLEGDLIERSNEISGEDGAAATAQWMDEKTLEQQFAGVMRVDDPEGLNELLTDAVEQSVPALKPYGVVIGVEESGDDRTITVKVDPKGKAAVALNQQSASGELDAANPVSPENPANAQLYKQLTSPQGLRIPTRQLDDEHAAYAYPEARLEEVIASWEGDGHQIGENERYERDLKAVDVPDKTSMFGWTDLPTVFESSFAAAGGGEDPSFGVLGNNLESVGGMVMWTDRRGDDGEVGVAHVVVPVHD